MPAENATVCGHCVVEINPSSCAAPNAFTPAKAVKHAPNRDGALGPVTCLHASRVRAGSGSMHEVVVQVAAFVSPPGVEAGEIRVAFQHKSAIFQSRLPSPASSGSGLLRSKSG